MLTQNFQNFAHSSLNSPTIQINSNIEEEKNIGKIREKKSKKPVGCDYSGQDWRQKILMNNAICFIKGTF